MRDMRGAVTRQLIAQDAEIAAIKVDVVALTITLKTEVAVINTKLDEVLARLPKA